MSNKIKVEVVYALSEKQYIQKITVNSSSTIKEVIFSSNLLRLCREIDLNKNKVGIYGKIVELSYIVKNGDRVEIYRPLLFGLKKLHENRKIIY